VKTHRKNHLLQSRLGWQTSDNSLGNVLAEPFIGSEPIDQNAHGVQKKNKRILVEFAESYLKQKKLAGI
jgi:hypothetical protein